MTTCFLAPDPCQSTFFVPGGNTPGNGAQVFFYVNLSSTKQTVYKDPTASVAWPNPIVLDSGGNLPSGGEVWFPTGQTFTVKWAPSNDTDPPVSPYRTMDNLVGMNDTSSVATSGEWVTGPAPTFVSATSFTLVGDQTAIFKIGRRVKTTNTGGTVYSTIVNSVFGALTAVTLQNDSGALDAGLSAVFYSILAPNQPSVPPVSAYVKPEVRGRLTLSPGNPVTTTDVSGATSVMFTPYLGNSVDLFDGTLNWNTFRFTELSTPVPVSTAIYDVFLFASSGILALSTTAWTNLNTRAVALSTQSAVSVQAGDPTKLYLGSFLATSVAGTTTVQDTVTSRALWNQWNPLEKQLLVNYTTGTFTYPAASSGNITVMGGDSTNACAAVFGQPTNIQVYHSAVGRAVTGFTSASLLTIGAAVGVDSFNQLTTGTLAGRADVASANFGQVIGMYNNSPGIGLHRFVPVIQGVASTTYIWIGSSGALGNQGLTGTFRG